MKRDPLHELLNKLVAICETLGRGSYAELAKAIQANRQQISDWVVQRGHKPSADVVLALQEWAADKTLVISRSQSLSEDYRKEMKIACLRFPVTGRKKA